jgi:Uma2 family endonuclease
MTFPDKIVIPERYTYKDYKLWEGDWELINGYPFAMSPSPNRKQQSFGVNFKNAVKIQLTKNKDPNCQVYYELDWIIRDDTVVRPNVMIVCGKFETDFLTFPPSLILEIISPDSRMRDINTKFTLYEMCGVNNYLVADIDKESIEVYRLANNKYQEEQTNLFKLTDNCSVEIDYNSLW